MVTEFKQDNIFDTERLLVRRLISTDIGPFHEMQGNIEVMKYAGGKANSMEEDIKDLAYVMGCYDKPDNDFWVWAAVDKGREECIGTIALVKDKEENWEIGFRLPQSQWGKGYATELVEGLIKLCESIDGLDNIIAYVDLRNVGSQKVLSKTGFVNLGIKYNDEEDCEDYIYSVSTRG
ncbi:GNAT family N-acetyltransferase [Portibacter lacus]|uniref:N-acetyltransferase domain-containing protein n=1 Tax=Portibacter lacus TaxID=1099794 RepID=A0AA37WDY6_9BACT|nr:GNAT family N-acetyltransferase [Portibacter lacus]GLR18341.1 hypothetical protein GCM10007940_29570 [Portibacter lacus]